MANTARNTPTQTVPEWTLGWRLRRSLAWGGVSTAQMADELDVTATTISRWCNDHGAPPRSIYLRAWAAKCRVPVDWLMYGDDACAARDSNPKPAGLAIHGPNPPDIAEIMRFRKSIGHTGVIRSSVRSDLAGES